MKRSPLRKRRLVLWAIDPFEVEQFKAQEDAIRSLERLVDPNVVVQPVFVWGGRPMGDAIKASQVERQAELIMGKWPKPALEAQTRPLKVIVAPGTTSARAKALARYAKQVRCALILTSHHTRSPLKRAFVGSFSESLSLFAQSPLLVVPPSTATSSKRGILFATDFSKASLAVFDEVLRLASVSRSKLTLFHKIERLNYYPAEVGYAYSSDVLEALVEDAEFSLAEMETRAAKAGVKVETVLDSEVGHVGQAIVTEAKRGFGLVALAAHKGFWDRVVMGSASRYVLRECPAPVWVLRPTPEALAKRDRKDRKRTRSATEPSATPGIYLV